MERLLVPLPANKKKTKGNMLHFISSRLLQVTPQRRTQLQVFTFYAKTGLHLPNYLAGFYFTQYMIIITSDVDPDPHQIERRDPDPH
jgi:hypothetical protein